MGARWDIDRQAQAWERIAAMRCRTLTLLALAALLGGCAYDGPWSPGFWSYEPQVRGSLVETDALKQLVPGTSTKADATALLGSPTAKGSFDPNTWLYIGQITKPRIGAFQDVEKQSVVVLSFNQAGVLQGITQKNDDDALPAPMIAGATPAPGNDVSFLQQLLGNVGRFGTSAGNPGQTAPSGGAPGSGNY